jgi:hypothetical protein
MWSSWRGTGYMISPCRWYGHRRKFFCDAIPTGTMLLKRRSPLLGKSYAFDERRRLNKRGHLQALVMQVDGKIK